MAAEPSDSLDPFAPQIKKINNGKRYTCLFICLFVCVFSPRYGGARAATAEQSIYRAEKNTFATIHAVAPPFSLIITPKGQKFVNPPAQLTMIAD